MRIYSLNYENLPEHIFMSHVKYFKDIEAKRTKMNFSYKNIFYKLKNETNSDGNMCILFIMQNKIIDQIMKSTFSNVLKRKYNNQNEKDNIKILYKDFLVEYFLDKKLMIVKNLMSFSVLIKLNADLIKRIIK